jgi:ribulose-5-phosphate 4-epimerase/fuculose-1-phosphate aldolase
MKVGHVPMLRYQRPGSGATAEEVPRVITHYGESGRPVRAVMLQRLGPNVWHDTPAAAMAVLEELEETARLVLLAQGPCPLLTEIQIEELRQTFGARW